MKNIRTIMIIAVFVLPLIAWAIADINKPDLEQVHHNMQRVGYV